MTFFSQDFLKSPYNFFDHTESHIRYNDSILLSGLHIDNKLGLSRPLTLIYKEYGQAAIESNDENIFWLPSPISPLVNDAKALASEVNKRIEALQLIYSDNTPNSATVNAITAQEAISLVHPFRWYAFGHLHDSLSKLFRVKDLNINRSEVKYIVADSYRIKDFNDHLSALAGHTVEQEQIINIGKAPVVNVHTLWHIHPPSIPTTHTAASYNWLLDSYLKYFKINEYSPKYLLYLSRNAARQGSRQVLNEQEILAYLHGKGFIVVDGSEPLSEIVRLFSSARIIIGAHGSLFANTIYCQAECQIVEFCPNNRIDVSLQVKFKRAKNYIQIKESADSNFNISIPLDKLATILAQQP